MMTRIAAVPDEPPLAAEAATEDALATQPGMEGSGPWAADGRVA
jgi:hypothetical protein